VEDVHIVDPALVGVARRLPEERFDLLLGLVRQLLPGAVEQLDAVVLGRVVRRGDDRAEVEREQGVGSTPASIAFPPAEATPEANACSSSRPEARVSRPIRTAPPPCQSVAARPSRSTSAGVRSRPTTPRTPSVPKYLRFRPAGGSASCSRSPTVSASPLAASDARSYGFAGG